MNAVLPQTADTIFTSAGSIWGTVCGGIVEDGIEEWLNVDECGFGAWMLLVVEGRCASLQDTVPEVTLSCDVRFVDIVLPCRCAPKCYQQN